MKKITVCQLVSTWGWWVIRPKSVLAIQQRFATAQLAVNYANTLGLKVSEVKPFIPRQRKKLPFCYSNARALRGEAFRQETNDCAVVAYSLVTGISYPQVHALFAVQGRKDRHGTYDHQLAPLVRSEKFRSIQLRPDCGSGKWVEYPTLKTFLSTHPTGTYYISIRSHALAIYDGMIFDHTPRTGSQKVFRAYEFLG